MVIDYRPLLCSKPSALSRNGMLGRARLTKCVFVVISRQQALANGMVQGDEGGVMYVMTESELVEGDKTGTGLEIVSRWGQTLGVTTE